MAPATSDSDFQLLHIRRHRGVAFVTIDAPPINIMTRSLFRELASFADMVADDSTVQVVVLRSDHPDFFIAHFDVEAILRFPVDGPAVAPTKIEGFHGMCERFRTMPKATIAEIAGRIGGGGSELAMSFDMRFGATETMKLNQMEVPLGILPGGTGTQRLPRLVGRGRAMEIILGAVDVDAVTAERWGYLNRALPAADLRSFVTDLAYRIASFPPQAIALAKQSVNNADTLDLHDGLLQEQYLFQQLLRTDDAPQAMQAFLALGGQTRDVELMVEDVTGQIADHR